MHQRKIIAVICCALAFITTAQSCTYAAATAETPAITEETQNPPVKKDNAYIPKGVAIETELMVEINSKKLHVGDSIPLRTSQDLILNGVLIVPRGTRVDTIVTKARKAGGFGHSGKLEFVIRSVTALNGTKIPLTANYKKRRGNQDGAIAVFTVASMLGGAFMKGRNVVYPARTPFTANVPYDADLGVSWENLAADMDPAKPHGQNIVVKH